MKKYTILLWIVLIYGAVSSVKAQKTETLFQPYTWEQASGQAVRENKLVLVEIGRLSARTEQLLLRQQELVQYLQRKVVAIRIEVESTEGQAFLPRLWLFEPPRFAFFMPYGDLLESVPSEEVFQRPEILKEVLEKAVETAAVKKRNSRAIQFMEESVEKIKEKAEREEKPVFVYVRERNCQPGLLMEKNVFNLDRVADFYQQHFISVVLDPDQAREWAEEVEGMEKPIFIFLNAQGKRVAQIQGYHSADELMEAGKSALEKVKGIRFLTVGMEEAEALARKEGKSIFVDAYVAGNAHNEMLRTVFSDPEVADFFNRHFISIAREEALPVLLFPDADGNELHRVTGVGNAGELLAEGRRVVEGKGLRDLERQYQQGRRDTAFLHLYITILDRAGHEEDASQVALDYLLSLPVDCLQQSVHWNLFHQYVMKVPPAFLDEVMAQRKALYALYGEETVRQKIAAVWVSGAEDFIKENEVDEVGFKEYVKHLKQEKIEGWRFMVRDARMHVAGKIGDWRTFVELAEEKWKEETISDAELYRWGLMIHRECHDEAIRYKAARWFAEEAIAMERRERQSGKVKLSSYKGFFEKLADDLVGKK